MDDADPGRERRGGVAKADGAADDAHLAAVGPMDPRQELAQRALACPVLTDQPVARAGRDVEADAVESDAAGEAFGDARGTR